MIHPLTRLALCFFGVFLALFSAARAQNSGIGSGPEPPPPMAKQAPAQEEGATPHQRDPASEEPVLQELQKTAPKAVETFKSATTALDSNNFVDAITKYNDVLKQAPNFEPAMRRLGYAMIGSGKRDEGIAMVQKAVGLHRSADNLVGLASAILGFNETSHQPSKAEEQRALLLLREALKANPQDEPQVLGLVAQVSLDVEDLNSFRDATTNLTQKYPDLPQTHYFRGIALADDGKFDEASQEITKAEAAGLKHDEAQRLQNAFKQAQDESMFGLGGYIKYMYPLGGVVLLWAVGLVVLFVVGKVLSSKTLHSIENSDPNDITGGGQAGLRSFYRKLITFAGIYYYISQPFVIVLVIAVTVGIIFFFLFVGWIPIKLLLILAFVGAASIFYMVKSLFVRTKKEDPGRTLSQAEAPGLWSLVREVAETVNTRPVDEIRVTEGTDLAVYERGGMRVKMQDKADRILIVGVAILNNFKQNAFRAVLAHEYGHFSNRDTAGGDVAYRVNLDIMRLAEAMVISHTNTVYNLAFQFLRLYHFLFRRITFGATRLQETLADRVAAYHYGAIAFREGLTHVVRRDAEFQYLAVKEIDAALGANRAFNNVYDLSATEDSAAKDIETKFSEAMNRPTTDDDTHPSPNDRVRLVEKVVSKEAPEIDGEVWDLFMDRKALTDEMNKNLEGRVKGAKYGSSHDIITES